METSTLISILLGLFPVIYFIYSLAYKNRNYWKDRGVPYLRDPLPFFGNTISFITRTQSVQQFSQQTYKEFEGERFCGYLTNRKPVFMPLDPELINAIFVKDFDHFHDRFPTNPTSNILSNGLFSLTGDKWRNLRYNMTPIFTANKLRIMFNSIKNCSDEVTLHLKEKNNTCEAKDLFFKLVINVIGDVAFGIKVNAFTDVNGLGKAFLEGTNNLFSPPLTTLLRNILRSTCPQLANLLRLRMISKEVEMFFYTLVKDMLKKRQESKSENNDFLKLMIEKREKEKVYMKNLKNKNKIMQDQNIEEEPEDFELLEQLKHLKHTVNEKTSTQYKELFTDECIAAQAFTFISAGSETVSTVLSFTFFELALNQDVQTRLNEEIDATINEFGFNYESIKKMTYLEQVLNESMRKYPPAGTIFRYCTKDYHVPESNITLNKGTSLLIPVIGLHMDPKYFPDPEKFDPDRFSDINSMPKNVYFPFGAGPRLCIDCIITYDEISILHFEPESKHQSLEWKASSSSTKKFKTYMSADDGMLLIFWDSKGPIYCDYLETIRLAMLEMKIVLATLISNFKVTLSKKTKLPLVMDPTTFVPKAIGGIWLEFESRKSN